MTPIDIGREALAKGDFEAAHEQFTKAFASGSSFEAGLGLAETLLKLDRWQEARDVAFKTMRLRSTSPDAITLYADALYRGGNLNDAGVNYLRALGLDINHPRARVGLAILKLARGGYDEALSHLQEAIADRPELAKAYYWLGLVFELQGRPSLAADAYEKFLSLKATGFPEAVLAENLDQRILQLRSYGQTTPFGLAGPASVTLPFDLSQGIPTIIAELNGVKAKLAIDSSLEDDLVVQAGFAEKLRLTRKSGPHNYLTSLKLGELNISNVPVRVLTAVQADDRGELTGVDGLIGIGWLRRSVVTLDYQAGTLTIANPSFTDSLEATIAPSVNGQPPKVSIRLPFQLVRNRILLPAAIQDEPVTLLLDLGHKETTISNEFSKDHVKPDALQRIGAETYINKFPLAMAGQELRLTRVMLAPPSYDALGRQVGAQFTGALGEQFLRQMVRVRIDFVNFAVSFDIDQARLGSDKQ